MATIPASGVDLTALGQVRVFARPDPNAEVLYYADKDEVKHRRDYREGDSLGYSLGKVETATTGEQYLKINSFRWVAIRTVFGIVVDKGREFNVSYVLLSDRDKLWTVNTGAEGLGEAESAAAFLQQLKDDYLPLADWQGVPAPVSVKYLQTGSPSGGPDWQLVFPNGKQAWWSTFKAQSLVAKLALLADDADTGNPSLTGKTSNKTSDLGLYLAGGAVLVLLGVVIVFQYIRKRRNQP